MKVAIPFAIVAVFLASSVDEHGRQCRHRSAMQDDRNQRDAEHRCPQRYSDWKVLGRIRVDRLGQFETANVLFPAHCENRNAAHRATATLVNRDLLFRSFGDDDGLPR